MLKEYEEKIFESAPILYKQKDLPMTQTCMCWGIECPDSWFNLLLELSKTIEEYNHELKQFDVEIQACQVKEKFGSLRFYYDIVYQQFSAIDKGLKHVNDIIQKVSDLVNIAESESMQICSLCGSKKNVILDNNGWISYICKECDNLKKKQKLTVKK